MKPIESVKKSKLNKYFLDFVFNGTNKKTEIDFFRTDSINIPRFTNEFWTSKQRQSNNLHEIAYRACFKSQLPNFFIPLLTKESDVVYDPFSGRGTTVIEAALLNRKIVSNDINPLSKILCRPRLFMPDINKLEKRLKKILTNHTGKADIDLSMFYHPATKAELATLKNYLYDRKSTGKEDRLDSWIRMVATNRLSGHSKGYFSVYTLPPNLAVSPENQEKINKKKNQKPEYRDVKKIIIKKSKSLIRDIDTSLNNQLRNIARSAKFITQDAGNTNEIKDESIKLTVTSPPFLDIVQYSKDNWLRCWFNSLDIEKISNDITSLRSAEEWINFMEQVFRQLYRVTQKKGHVVFEVGEVRNGKIKLDELVIPVGVNAGFKCEALVINTQQFTKTSNIWGITNNTKGTNTNRIIIFRK